MPHPTPGSPAPYPSVPLHAALRPSAPLHTPPHLPPALPTPPAPSSLQAVSEVWKQQRVSPDPIFSSPTSPRLEPFVSEKPFGVLCLFFPSSMGNYSECISMCFPKKIDSFTFWLCGSQGKWDPQKPGLPRGLPIQEFSQSQNYTLSPVGTSHPLQPPFRPLNFSSPIRLQPGWARHLSTRFSLLPQRQF